MQPFINSDEPELPGIPGVSCEWVCEGKYLAIGQWFVGDDELYLCQKCKNGIWNDEEKFLV